jgi:hypothetical protein
LNAWEPGHVEDSGQAVRNLLCVASNADVTANLREAQIARVVFDQLRGHYERGELIHILAWIILSPEDGTTITHAPELGLRRQPPEAVIRERNSLYAKKLLGRLLGKIPD